MQLVAYGAQDVYLTGNPQITFFKVVYRRHTNFSMEAIQQTWSGTSSGANGRCTATISRNGDLINRMYLEVVGKVNDNRNDPGSQFIKDVELEIGGQSIDKQSGVWMEVLSELTDKHSMLPGVMIGDKLIAGNPLQRMSGMCGVEVGTGYKAHLYVPLQFWFCRNPGLALPLIALQYHEVKVTLEHYMADVFDTADQRNELWVDYIYLDTDERRRFAQVSHEYLIEQIQEQSLTQLTGKGNTKDELNFNHPVKELIWTDSSVFYGINGGLASVVGADATVDTKYKLTLNGHERFAERDYTYFTRCQPWQFHSGGSMLTEGAHAAAGHYSTLDSIAVYSFALKPEEHQPSGTCNFSRIDNAELSSIGGEGYNEADKIFAVNYNVLRIMSGMGGLAYSN